MAGSGGPPARSGFALGRDNTRLEVIGFSSDGSYIAHHVSGFDDGSRETYNMIRVVDVAANEVLEEREVEIGRCDALRSFELKPRIFTLSVRGRGFRSILQQDRVLFAFRRCPYLYRIYRIYVYGDKIAGYGLGGRIIVFEEGRLEVQEDGGCEK